MADYRLISTWRLHAPLQPVYDAIVDSLQWPQWWPGADVVEHAADGDSNGIGCLRRYVWKGRLPYRLGFTACVTRIEPLRLLEATVSGDLEGTGRWTFAEDGGITTVRHEWYVRTTRHWMNALAPVSRRIFENNHHALMREGARRLALLLGAPLLAADSRALPAVGRHTPQAGSGSGNGSGTASGAGAAAASIDWRAGALAGLAAGVAATMVQLMLWWSAAYRPLEMLLRDSRLAAAIVLGRAVLPPPASFDWTVMLVASVLHVVLSVIYGLLLAALIARLAPRPACVAGTVFGLLLFAVNMYGFTLLFPWFAASRDWITAAAHAAFGLSGAIAYQFRQQLVWRLPARKRTGHA